MARDLVARLSRLDRTRALGVVGTLACAVAVAAGVTSYRPANFALLFAPPWVGDAAVIAALALTSAAVVATLVARRATGARADTAGAVGDVSARFAVAMPLLATSAVLLGTLVMHAARAAAHGDADLLLALPTSPSTLVLVGITVWLAAIAVGHPWAIWSAAGLGLAEWLASAPGSEPHDGLLAFAEYAAPNLLWAASAPLAWWYVRRRAGGARGDLGVGLTLACAVVMYEHLSPLTFQGCGVDGLVATGHALAALGFVLICFHRTAGAFVTWAAVVVAAVLAAWPPSAWWQFVPTLVGVALCAPLAVTIVRAARDPSWPRDAQPR